MTAPACATLVVPVFGAIEPADDHLMRWAASLGIACRTVEHGAAAAGIDPVKGSDACLVINPAVLGRWGLADLSASTLAHAFGADIRCLLVHAVDPGGPGDDLLRALTGGALLGARPAEDGAEAYEVSAEAPEICGAFGGLAVPRRPAGGDRVLVPGAGDLDVLVALGEAPLLARVRHQGLEVFVLGAVSIADPDIPCEAGSPLDHFSQLIAPLMVLRHVFRGARLASSAPRAVVMIDDPPLWMNYGFLNFERLLALADELDFHASIAFIPHNYRRSASAVVDLVRARPDRISLCYHGNDHTAAEFGATEPEKLGSIIASAQRRIAAFEAQTRITVEPVMVFPQGVFSAQALTALAAWGFRGAMSSGARPTPDEGANVPPVTLAERVRPCLLRLGRAPLFLRLDCDEVTPQDIACRAFLGQPILIFGHHDLLRDSSRLTFLVEWINRRVDGVIWCSAQSAMEQSYSGRRDAAGQRGETMTPAGGAAPLGLAWTVRAYGRRRLSEMRDQYLSRTPRLLKLTQFAKAQGDPVSAAPLGRGSMRSASRR